MKKKQSPRIVEIMMHRSKRYPRLGHVVASLFPCGHKQYLGIARMKGDRNHYRVTEVKIIKVETFIVMDNQYCGECPNEDFWLRDTPLLEVVNKELPEEDDND